MLFYFQTSLLEFDQSKWLKLLYRLNLIHKREQKLEKNNGQNGIEQFNNAAYGKTMKKLRNKVNIRVVNNKYDYLK